MSRRKRQKAATAAARKPAGRADTGKTAPRAPRRILGTVVIAAVLVGAAVTVWWLGRAAGSPADGPIVLVSIDTLRADRLPAYGYRKISTPAIDAFAAGAVLFERAYAHSPQTLPSHASILTGRLPFETGVRDNVGFTLKPDGPLLARLLRDRGFTTGGAVSAYVMRRETGLAEGFDFYDSQMPAASPDTPVGQVQRDGLATLEIATRWAGGLTTPKLFLFFHIYEPHKPYSPPARYSAYDPYDGEVAYSDEIVGKLFSWLKDHRLYDTSTIILLSDHGEGLGDHGEQEHGLFLYNETTQVPLIVRLPGGAHGGRRVAAPVQLIDLVPTILDLVGAPGVAGLRGRSLVPLLLGRAATLPLGGIYAEAFYSRYHYNWSELVSLTDERYKFIRAPRDELYDLREDPREARDVASSRAQTRLAMRSALEKISAGAPIHSPSRVSAEDRQRLAALGYVGSTAQADIRSSGDALPDPKDKIAILELHRRAVDLAGQRDFDQAIRLLRQVVADSPEMKDVWIQLAHQLMQVTRYEEAMDAYKRLVELDPADPTGVTGVASALVSLGRIDQAARHIEAALALAPAADVEKRVSTYEMAARIAVARGDARAAQRFAALAQEADPGLPMPSYVQALVLRSQGRFEEALPLLEETIRKLTGRAITITDVHYLAGDSYARLGRDAEAEAAFREEIRLSPQHIQARAHLAMLYRAAGRAKDAEQAIDRMLRASPSPAAYALAARLWTVFGEPRRAAAVQADGDRRFGQQPMRQAADRLQREVNEEQRRIRAAGRSD